MKIGYARVSSTGQSLEIQLEALTAAGCDKIYQEKKSGRSTSERHELSRAIEHLRAGDVLVVTRLDRLARSVPDLYAILAELTDTGAGFTCLQQGAIDTTTPSGKLMFAILGAVAEFENDLRRERQREGIERAKAAGVYRGRKVTIDHAAVIEALRAGRPPTELARELGVGRSSIYRIADDAGGLAAIKQGELA